MDRIKSFFVKKIYADQNSSKAVKTVLKKLLQEIPANGIGLNVGSGETRLDPRVKNMEIAWAENVDLIGRVEFIPLADERIDLIITQEVLEHIERPLTAMKEMARVLKHNGKLYLQVPFIIGFHPCPNDFWRFTKEGIMQLAKDTDFIVLETGYSVGSATGFYRIAVEFFSILLSIPVHSLYRPFKGFFSLLLYPIKWLDPLFNLSSERHRISGGFYVVCEKSK